MSERETIRSIFKQRVYVERYKVVAEETITNRGYGGSQTVYDLKKNITHKNLKKDIDIIEIYLDSPPLKVGEKIYLEELGYSVEVYEKHRTSQGGMVYYIEPKFIEDDKTSESHEEAMQTISNYKENKKYISNLLDKNRNLQSELVLLRHDYNEVKKRWWYKMFSVFSK